jgi:hypothetical protein
MNKSIQKIVKEMIFFHGFSSNTKTGFSCYIPDPKPFSTKEGLLLWVCTPKGKRVLTKIERLVSKSRKKRLIKFLDISEHEYIIKYTSKIIDYSNLLINRFSFHRIGKGVSVNINPKLYNMSLNLSNFENDLKLLRTFEVFLINNPLTLFAEEMGYFTVKEKNNLLFDRYFKNT